MLVGAVSVFCQRVSKVYMAFWEKRSERTSKRYGGVGGYTFVASISLLIYVVYCLRGACWCQERYMARLHSWFVYAYCFSSAESWATQPRITSNKHCASVACTVSIVKGPPFWGGPPPTDVLDFSFALMLRTVQSNSGRCNLSNA